MINKKYSGNKKESVSIGIIIILIFILSWQYYFDEEFLVSNTIEGIQIGKYSILFGSIISILILYTIRKSKFLKIKYLSIIIIVGALIIPIILVTKLGYQINQKFGETTKNTESSIILEMDLDIIPQNHWITIQFSNRKHRLMISKKMWKELNVGDSIEFQTRKGYFGFDIISEIIKYELDEKRKMQ